MHQRHIRPPLAIASSFCFLSVSALALSGCTNFVGSMAYDALSVPQVNIYEAKVQSPHPPYQVTWVSISKLGVKPNTPKVLPDVNITQGSYRNWVWHVNADTQVAASWDRWRHRAKRPPNVAPADRNKALLSQLDWESGFERLWNVSRYLLGSDPPPVSITLTLLPHDQPYHVSTTTRGMVHLPLRLVSWFPAGNAKTPPSLQAGFRDYAKALARVGEQIERVSLAGGITAAPPGGEARVLKNWVNATCFDFSIQAALAAGTAFAVPPGKPVGTAQVALASAVYSSHKKSPLAQKTYGTILALRQVGRYLQYEGQTWPDTGKDLRGIDSFLDVCRVLVHYPGDIRKQPLPLATVHRWDFFKLSSATTAAAERVSISGSQAAR